MRLDHLDQTVKPAQYVAHHHDSITADDSNSQRNPPPILAPVARSLGYWRSSPWKPANQVERRTQHRMEDKTPRQRSLYTSHMGRSYFHNSIRTLRRQTWSTTSSTNWSPQQQGCHPETQFHCPRRLPLYGRIFMEKDSQGRSPKWQQARNRHLGLSLNSNRRRTRIRLLWF